MRVLVFFDLPRLTNQEMKIANQFRIKLIKDGFLMLQESVYCKLALNQTAVESLKLRIKKFLPQSGNIMILSITEKQFSAMDICCNNFNKSVVDTDKRLVIL